MQNSGVPGQVWTPETPWVKSDKKTLLHWPSYVCRNPSCKSFGKSHPNCQCGAPGTRETLSGHQQGMPYAQGGEVHHCSTGNAHLEDCEYFADGGEIKENQQFLQNPELSLDHSVLSHGLVHLLTKTGHTKSEDPARVMGDHLDHHRSGKKHLQAHSKNIFDMSHKEEHKKDRSEALKSKIEEWQQNPTGLLEVGGAMADTMPDQAGALGAKAAALMNHFQILKPKMPQANPMSEPMKPSKMELAKYDRQIHIAENPSLIYNDVKNGTVHPDDIQTLQIIYPKLYDEMKNKATEALIEAKTEGKQIPYKNRIGLSKFLNQPLDFSLSMQGMQAIMKANGGAQSQQQAPQGKKGSVSSTTLKAMQKMDSLYESPIEDRQIDQRK